MKAYIEGRLSKDNEKIEFLLSDLWFSETKDYDNIEDCTRISSCFCETAGEGNEVSTRWKGVDYQPYDRDYEELNDLIRLRELIEGKYIVNAEAYYNDDVDFYIDSVKFVNGNEEWVFPKDKVENEIVFIN